MRIYNEGFRRVTAEGEFEANQSSKLRFGILISVACISSLSLVSEANGNAAPPIFSDDIDGDLNLFSSIDVSHIIEQRTVDSSLAIGGSVIADVEFSRQVSSKIDLIALAGEATWEEAVLWNTVEDNWGELTSVNKPKVATQFRDATSTISLTFNGGSANWEAPVFWENMDVYWDAPESSSTPYLAKVHNRNASSSLSISGSIGTADYESSVFWEYMDVNWDDEDTSTGNEFFSVVHERTPTASMSINTTVGQAGWASDFIWEALDIDWDDNIAGQIHQGGASISTEISASVNGEVSSIFSLSTSSLFSLSTNLNSELIQGWNSETTFMENLNRNWEAI